MVFRVSIHNKSSALSNQTFWTFIFQMDKKVFITCLLFFALAQGQRSTYRSSNWRTTGSKLDDWPKLPSILPYGASAENENYPVIDDSREKPQYKSRPYPDSYYSSEYQEMPYGYPSHYSNMDQSISSYESQRDTRPMNLTSERIGGFAGYGDTQGFGAYEHPVRSHQVLDSGEPNHQIEMPIPDMLVFGPPHPMADPILIHPVPPPL